MQWVDGKVVDVGKVGIFMELYRLMDDREALHAKLLLGVLPVLPVCKGPEPVVVEEVARVAPQWPRGPPASLTAWELASLVLSEAETQEARELR